MAARTIAVLAAAGLALAAVAARAEDADHYRGGWRVEGPGARIIEFVIDGNAVSGIACARCADGTTLARIDGRFGPRTGLVFAVRHLKADGTLASLEHLTARLRAGHLEIDGPHLHEVASKDPRGPTPGAYPQAVLPPGAPRVRVIPPAGGAGGGGGGRPVAYVQPGPWRQLSATDVAGVWLGFGVGIDKQYFVIRRDGERLFGLACGRCDNPYTIGALEHFAIHGDTLEFDIMHQDWGEGDHVPFVRHVTAHIAMNEMSIDARRADVPGGAPIVASLVGPISLAATAGNR